MIVPQRCALAQIAAGTGPDIGLIAESFMPQCISTGIALDITDYMDRINLDDYFSATFYNAAYQDGIEDWIIAERLTYENEFDR